MKFQRKDRKSSLFWGFLGALTILSACRFGLGTLTNPGPGFMPFLGGLIMVVLAIVLHLQSLRSDAEGEKELVQIGNYRILLSILCLILYSLFFRRIGFISATFLLLTLLLQIYERKSWLTSAFVSLVAITISYMIFVVWLKVQLPKGFIGF